MSTFIQTLRQDLISLRWYLPGWVVCLVLFVVHHIAKVAAPSVSVEPNMLVLGLAMIGSGAGVFGTLLFNHPASNERSAWHTRPLQRFSVGVEKLVMVGVLLVLPLACLIVLFEDQPFAFGDARDSVTLLVIPFLVATFVGVACRTSSQFLVALLGLFMSGSLCVSGLTWLNDRYAWFTFSETGASVALLLFVIGFSGLIVWHYAKPHHLRHWMGATVVLGLIVVVSSLTPDPRRRLPNVKTDFHAATALSLESLADRTGETALKDSDPDQTHDDPSWLLTIRMDGFDSAHLWHTQLLVDDYSRYAGPRIDHTNHGYFHAESLITAAGIQGFTIDGVEDEKRIKFKFRHRGNGKDPAHVSPGAQVSFLSVRLTPSLFISGPLREGEHFAPATGRGLIVHHLKGDQRSFRYQLLTQNEEEPPTHSALGGRASHFVILAVHDASHRAALLHKAIPMRTEEPDASINDEDELQRLSAVAAEVRLRRAQRQGARLQSNGWLQWPDWDVPASEMRLVVMLNRPDARVMLSGVELPK